MFLSYQASKKNRKDTKKKNSLNFPDGTTTTAVVSPPGGIYSPISKAIIEHILIIDTCRLFA